MRMKRQATNSNFKKRNLRKYIIHSSVKMQCPTLFDTIVYVIIFSFIVLLLTEYILYIYCNKKYIILIIKNF